MSGVSCYNDILNPKHQITNHKWFDRLTTLSKVEG